MNASGSELRGAGAPEEGLPARGDGHTRRRVTVWLMLAAAAGVLATMPYEQSITYQAESLILPWPLLLIGGLVNLTLILVCVTIGLHLGPSLELGAPDLYAWVEHLPGVAARLGRNVRSGLFWGGSAGVSVALLGAAADRLLPLPDLEVPAWTPWQGLLGAFGAGVNEELIFRLGLMTLFARFLVLLTRRRRPGPVLLWAANAIAALGFGFAHLPILALITDPTPLTIGLVLLGNGIVGVVFGWLFWRRGLVAAMAGHFATDVVIKAIVPAIAPA